MPMFLCPCCGDSYVVPLAFCQAVVDEHRRMGWKGTVAPALCLSCQQPIAKGDAIVIRRGEGVVGGGERQVLPAGSKATVLDAATSAGEGTIFLVRLASGAEAYLTRAQITLDRA